MIFKTGDVVTATFDGRTVDALVILASANGRSLAISFDAMLGGHVGMMPVLQREDGNYEALITAEPIMLALKKGTS